MAVCLVLDGENVSLKQAIILGLVSYIVLGISGSLNYMQKFVGICICAYFWE